MEEGLLAIYENMNSSILLNIPYNTEKRSSETKYREAIVYLTLKLLAYKQAPREGEIKEIR